MPQTDAAAVALARDGDSEAFRALVERHGRAVYRVAHRMTGNAHDAEDVVQETFLRAYKQLQRFESRANFGTWLHRIAVNAALARGRRGHLEVVPAPPSEEGAEPESTVLFDTLPPLDVEAAIESLPEGARHVLVLYGIYGYTHEEAANMLGIAVGTCKAQLHRARRLLRERLSA